MSYDLYFYRTSAPTRLAPMDVLGYFRARPHYQIGPDGNKAVYYNEDTGVYFTFYLGDEEEEDAPPMTAGVEFNLNYFRPHVFGLEAESELRHFVDHFGLGVDDPQNDGMGRGAYSAEGFLHGWNQGNRLGYSAAVQQLASLDEIQSLSAAEIERVWRWNYRRKSFQAQATEDVFVPRISHVLEGGQLKSYVTWGDAIPMIFPPVDQVMLVRIDMAPRRMFGLLRGKPDLALVPWSSLEPILATASRWEDGYFLREPEKLPEVRRLYADARFDRLGRNIVDLDRVLDAELLAEVAR